MRGSSTMQYYVQAQYTFIHNALEELIMCRETTFKSQDIITGVNKLNSVVAGKGVTGFKEQFEVHMCTDNNMWVLANCLL